MPVLNWASKRFPQPLPAFLKLDSIVYPQAVAYPGGNPQDHLILGDNLAAMYALLPEYEGRIQLTYADPPFFSNRSYSARVGQGEDSRRPQEWKLAHGYADHWLDLDAYLDMLYPRLVLMHRLLAPTGSLYLHLDWHANAYARLLLDEIFGAERLLNEIVWVYHGPSPIRSAFNRKHDTILVYTKSDEYVFNVDAVRVPYDPGTVKTFESSPKAGFGKVPDLKRGKVPEDWWYFPVVARLHQERTGYPTQKPEALLERIILASSNPGDLVADFFCGSGTAAVVASKLGRRYIGGDATWRAIHTARARLVAAGTGPFDIQRAFLAEENAAISEPSPDGSQLPGISFHAETGVYQLERTLAGEMDYWEVDPNWDGQIFRSANQAWRPRRRGDIPAEIKVPAEWVGNRSRIRLVRIDGQQIELTIYTSSR
jgi:DNA modification methylase